MHYASRPSEWAFIGESYTYDDFKADALEHELSPYDSAIDIVNSVYSDNDMWWTEPEERAALRKAFPNKMNTLRTVVVYILKQEEE